MRGIKKCFGNKTVLNEIDLEIDKGTIHAIIGENGAGKSTLMNILSGALEPTEGIIEVDGGQVVLKGPQDAGKLGIGMVYQHFMLVPQLRVWQNVFLGIEPAKVLGKIDKKKAMLLFDKACKDYGVEVNPEQIAGKLTIGEQQRVEILKVMVRNAKYIIFDEPTAVLTPQETEQLLINIKSLRDKGKTIIFISHKLDEVLQIADEITVLRLGKKIGTVKREETTAGELVSMMIGRDIHIDGEPIACKAGKVILEVSELSTPRSQFSKGLQGISMEVREGEILGIAGVDGNGQTELTNAILGFEKILNGRIIKDGKSLTGRSPSEIRNSQISLIPPDRQKEGLVMDTSIIKNIVMGVEKNKEYYNGVFIDHTKVKEKAGKLVELYDVRVPGLQAHVSELSGGNQQKIILAREFGLRDSNLIIAVNPTRGLDVGAIEFVYEQLEKQKQEGKGILLISTELSEIMRLSDRIAVLYQGKCMGIVPRADATTKRIGEMMMGIYGKEAEGCSQR